MLIQTGYRVIFSVSGWPIQSGLGFSGVLQLHHLRGRRHVRHLPRPVLEIRQVLQEGKRLEVFKSKPSSIGSLNNEITRGL